MKMVPARAGLLVCLLLSALVSVYAGASAPQFCLDCCDAAGDFGFNNGEVECCEFGCAQNTDNSCDSGKKEEAFQAGVSILTDITQNFLIDGDEHVCFEDPPGTFNVAEATPAPTNAPTLPTISPTVSTNAPTVLGVVAAQFCLDCCDAARGFGFNNGEAECCEFGCAQNTDNSCDSAKQIEAFQAGVSIATDITQNFLIDGDEHVCFEDPPGTFNVAEATPAPTNAPTVFEAGQDDAAIIASLLVVGSLAGLAGLVYYRRRTAGVEETTDVETPPLKTTARIFGLNGYVGSFVFTRGNPEEGRTGPRIVSTLDRDRTFRSDILSYKQVARPSFEVVNAKRYKNAVSRTERTSFHQFKRLSTTSTVASKRTTVYFVDSTQLDTARIVEKVARKVKRSLSFKRNADGYSGLVEPEISLDDFLMRLVYYLDEWYNDPEAEEKKPSGVNAMLISLVYQSRMKSRMKTFTLTPYNVHRAFAVTMLLAAKFSEDDVITNKYWSEVSLIGIEELNKIEGAFCSALNFNLYVSPEEFKQYSKQYLPSSGHKSVKL